MDIKRIRLKNGLTQGEFGKIIGVSVQSVCAWEKGGNIRPCNIKSIIKYCKENNITY